MQQFGMELIPLNKKNNQQKQILNPLSNEQLFNLKDYANTFTDNDKNIMLQKCSSKYPHNIPQLIIIINIIAYQINNPKDIYKQSTLKDITKLLETFYAQDITDNEVKVIIAHCFHNRFGSLFHTTDQRANKTREFCDTLNEIYKNKIKPFYLYKRVNVHKIGSEESTHQNNGTSTYSIKYERLEKFLLDELTILNRKAEDQDEKINVNIEDLDNIMLQQIMNNLDNEDI